MEVTVEDLKKLYEEHLVSRKKELEKVKIEGFPENPVYYLTGIAGDYEMIAMGDYVLNHDMDKAKNLYYNIGLGLKEGVDLIYTKFQDEPFSMTNVFKMYYGILSDNKELILDLFDRLGKRERDNRGHIETRMNAWALKYMILGEDEKALEYIEKLEKRKGTRGLEIVFRGILDNDIDKIHEGLEFMVKKHRRSKAFGGYHKIFNFEVIAIAKVAEMRGFDVKFDNPMAPNEFIKIKPLKKYEPVGILKLYYDMNGIKY